METPVADAAKDNAKLFLHIGFGKCGSSALQHHLSMNPLLQSGKRRIEYAAMTHRGHLIRRERLVLEAKARPSAYTSSTPSVQQFVDSPHAAASVNRLLDNDTSVILSHESWAHQLESFRRGKFLPAIRGPVVVLAYVRPQVDWLNSAWWQWFYWRKESQTPEAFFRARGLENADWSQTLENWGNLPNVERVVPRLLGPDIATDFSNCLGLEASSGRECSRESNVTLTLPMLAVIARIPGLRGAKDSAVDFILQRAASLPGKKPWAISPALAVEIVNAMRPSNEKLLSMLDTNSAETMRSDVRWWSGAAYADRKIDDPLGCDLSEAQLLDFTAKVTIALVAAEKNLSRIRRARAMRKSQGKKAARATKSEGFDQELGE